MLQVSDVIALGVCDFIAQHLVYIAAFQLDVGCMLNFDVVWEDFELGQIYSGFRINLMIMVLLT